MERHRSFEDEILKLKHELKQKKRSEINIVHLEESDEGTPNKGTSRRYSKVSSEGDGPFVEDLKERLAQAQRKIK